MYEPAFAAAGSGVGGAAGAVPGVLGRSPLLDLLKPLDYPRQALWNLVRGPARLAQGEGSLDDILGMAPGLAGAGLAALGPLGLLGGALAGGAVQGLGKLTGSPAFEASTPQDVTGSEDFLPNLAVGAATDPLTYAGLGMGGRAGREIGKDLSVVPGGLEGFGREGALGRLSEQPAMQSLLDQAAQQLGPKQYARLPLEAAARQGLSSRNQALGEAVGQLAQQPRPQSFLEDVVSAGLAKDLGSGPRAPLSGSAPPLSPEQAFEQMLPDFQRYQKIGAAQQNPRNFLPLLGEDYAPAELRQLGQRPVRDLQRSLTPQEAPGMEFELDDAFAGRGEAPPRADVEQLRRYMALDRAGMETGRRMADQWGPLAAELQKTGQLGPIESRLQANWGMLGDQIKEGTLRQADLLSGIERNLGEDEAFRMIFERGNAGMPGGPAAWGGQQAALNQLLEGLGQAHPGVAGEPARDIASMLSGAAEPGTARFLGQPPRSAPLAQFGGRPVTAEQVQQSLQASELEHRLKLAAAHEGALLPSQSLTPNFWEPAAGASPPSALLPPGPAFPGEFSPGPAFPPLPEAIAQASQQVGRPLQPWEIQELQQALAQRNVLPFQQRGLIP